MNTPHTMHIYCTTSFTKFKYISSSWKTKAEKFTS